MYRLLTPILFVAFLFSNCSHNKKDKIDRKPLVNSNIYPQSAYVCFDREQKGIRKKEFKLGDSCSSYANHFGINCDELGNTSRFCQDLETRGKFGTTFTSICFNLDKDKRLFSFHAEWSHTRSSNINARKEFYRVVQSNAMSCLWETSLNTFKSRDTVKTVYIDNHVEEFISDFSGENWTIKYQCRLK